MARPPSSDPPLSKPPARKRAAAGGKSKKKGKGRGKKKPQQNLLRRVLLLGLEWLGLSVIGIAAVIMLLGHFANRFSGTDLVGNLLPFAGGIFACVVFATLLLIGWSRSRRWLLARWSRSPRAAMVPPAIVAGLALLAACLMPQDSFTRAFGYYRTLVGGKEEAGRVTLAHQVYAAYRRLDTAQLQKMIDRAEQYGKAIEEAAAVYDVDPDLLMGLAATESSFMPRTSQDGGHGLFQITRAPAAAVEAVDRRFPAAERSLAEPRYNAFMGAATLRHYLTEMRDDLFLGLLAYNIGPANGGLRFIMQQYGVTDFITIQPYLLQLPRDYPIRVLSYSLAFRIKRLEGRLLAYEEGRNAVHIQGMGIPGLAVGWRPETAARPGS